MQKHKTTRQFSGTSISYFTKIKDMTENNRLNSEKTLVENNRKMGFGMDYENYVECRVNFVIFFTRRLIYLTSGTRRLFVGKQTGIYLKITHINGLLIIPISSACFGG